MRLVRSDKLGSIIYNVNTSISYGCNASAFLSALNKFDSFSKYKTSVVRNMYNGNNNITENLTEAVRIDYVVSLFLLREETFSN